MKLLVLGGSAFVGRAVVAAGLDRGYDVTTYNRGRTAMPLPGVEALHGDRTSPADLEVLAGRSWDAVIDTWSGAPRHAGATARLLKGAVGHYGYVSSRSVYRWPPRVGGTEDDPVVDASPKADKTEYAADKRGAELAILDGYGDALLARAGLILGPHEDVGRLPWWLRRLAAGGEVLAPGPPDLPLQYVDARDFATWMLDCAERGTTGPFNVVSAPGHTTTLGLLTACQAATGGAGELVWVDPGFVEEHGIEPWTELPVWLPPTGEYIGMHRTDTSAALEAGLRCRPVADTVTDTWAWLRELAEPPLREGLPAPGLDPAKERRVLDAWRTGAGGR
jgi:2'-hydroxyisoflavone reductase